MNVCQSTDPSTDRELGCMVCGLDLPSPIPVAPSVQEPSGKLSWGFLLLAHVLYLVQVSIIPFDFRYRRNFYV